MPGPPPKPPFFASMHLVLTPPTTPGSNIAVQFELWVPNDLQNTSDPPDLSSFVGLSGTFTLTLINGSVVNPVLAPGTETILGSHYQFVGTMLSGNATGQVTFNFTYGTPFSGGPGTTDPWGVGHELDRIVTAWDLYFAGVASGAAAAHIRQIVSMV